MNALTGYSSGIYSVDITDHCPMFVHMPVSIKNCSEIKLTFRVHTPMNIEILKKAVTRYVGNLIFRDDVNTLLDSFTNELSNIYSVSFPKKVKYISSKRLCKPWLSTAILNTIHRKAQYFKLCKMVIISAELNRKYRNPLNSTIRAAKKKHIFRMLLSTTIVIILKKRGI